MKNREVFLMTFLVLLFSQASCSQKSVQDEEVLKGKRLAVFIEERNSKDGIWSGEFGEVVIMDLDTKKKYYVTDDPYYDTNPVFSPDGKNVLFQSSRDADELTLQIRGISGPYNIYIFNLESKKIKRIDIEYQKERGRFKSDIESVGWVLGEDSLCFTIGDNKIYKCSTKGGESRVVVEIINIKTISGISIIRNKDFFYSFYKDKEDLFEGLAYYNDNIKKSIIIVPVNGHIGDWNSKPDEFLYGEGNISNIKIFSYNVDGNKSSLLFNFNDHLVLCSKIFWVDEKSFLFLAKKIRLEEKKKIFELEKHLVIYDLKTDEYSFINEDVKTKDYLDVFVRE